MTLVVGGYALTWGRSAAQQAEVVNAMSASLAVGGLELPWAASIGSDQLVAVLGTTRPDWRVVITDLPGTMTRLEEQPTFGIASSDPAGRRAALTELATLRSAVTSLNDKVGRATVGAVEIHSAPQPFDVPAARSALARSLETISGWDWDGAHLLLEHVDAKVTGHRPSKGFLALEDEIGVIAGDTLPVGILLNWARSAIELRSAARVVDHVVIARQAGLLRGLIFSGVSPKTSAYGDAWADEHLPMSVIEPRSLLTVELMEDALRAAGPLDYTGVKMSWRSPLLSEGTAMVLGTARRVAAISDRIQTATSSGGR